MPTPDLNAKSRYISKRLKVGKTGCQQSNMGGDDMVSSTLQKVADIWEVQSALAPLLRGNDTARTLSASLHDKEVLLIRKISVEESISVPDAIYKTVAFAVQDRLRKMEIEGEEDANS